MKKKLYRSREDKMLGGVCGGIANYFGVDPTLIRLAFVLIFFADGAGLLAYIVAWILIPEKPTNDEQDYSEREKNDHDLDKSNIDKKDEKTNEKKSHIKDNKESDVYSNSSDLDSRENRKNNQQHNNNLSFFNKKENSQKVWGILLIILGGIFFVKTWFPFGLIEKMWPLVFVVIGLALLIRNDK